MRGSWAGRLAIAISVLALAAAAAVTGTGLARAAGPGQRTAATRFAVTGELYAVAATSASNAWAVGYSGVFDKTQQTLLLHWNGTRWSRVTTPRPRSGQLDGVYAASADDAWAVGFTSAPDGAKPRAEIMHWNGKAWSVKTGAPSVPGGLSAVTATASSVWAVGDSYGPALVERHRLEARLLPDARGR